MPIVEKSALIPYSAQKMFELVNDIERYQDFLPWCKKSQIIQQDDEKVCGELQIARLGIQQTFSSCNRLTPFQRIDIELLKGPFKELKGYWLFQELEENASKISLHLDFEFSGKLIDKAFGRVFSEIANTMVDAFCQRARKLYD